jgi:hypothetical protein
VLPLLVCLDSEYWVFLDITFIIFSIGGMGITMWWNVDWVRFTLILWERLVFVPGEIGGITMRWNANRW